ncbi:MAG: bifunctional transaldolase/phosoglucose isomerase [Acidobacteria bacterium]|nr:bifunctional transaldolase/phosoglucose isomerase [Acidobacteriota bacterium]
MKGKTGNSRTHEAASSAAVQEHARRANALLALQTFGQSVWLDYLRRSLFTSGEFRRLVADDGVRGVTSNPSIFEKAIAGSTDYLAAIEELEAHRDLEPMALYEAIAIRDIRDAADLLRPVYDATGRADGYASLEVSPYLAHDTAATIADAHRLWSAVNRENVMIKVPATAEGIPAIRRLIGDGVNVNITLLFSVRRYEEVARAFLDGLSAFVERGGDPAKVASVASFFVSRIDTAVDALLARRLDAAADPSERASLEKLMGQVAIANARLAYQQYLAVGRSDAWQRLSLGGAHPQRLLWASTSTKNPRYSDVRYVEELIGRDTVNTITPATLDAFRDHGRPRASLEEGVEEAHRVLAALDRAGISLDQVTGTLLDEGVRQFSEAFDRLLTAVDQGRRGELRSTLDRQQHRLPHDLDVSVRDAIAEWQQSGRIRRLWARDATLWTGQGEDRWLGWLGIADDQRADLGPLKAFAEEVTAGGFSQAVLLGMGGSSLCPEVLRATFGTTPGFLDLRVLDSTDPAQIAEVEQAVDLAHTLFIVSSKSGTTLEPDILLQHFLARVKGVTREGQAGAHFVAITDPDSPLQHLAGREKFRRVFPGVPSIGGRYSALSNFGLVPAALMGIDVARLLDRAELMVHSCAASVPAAENPAVVLGVLLGTLAAAGRDKITFVASPGIADLGAWLEQLIAESTGKHGKGIIPVDGEPLGAPDDYGGDRLFVHLRLESGPEPAQDAAIDALERAGHPVVRIAIAEIGDIAQEFFRWEMATAVAGAILGINPFDQPDVEASKVATRELTVAFEKSGRLPDETPIFEGEGLSLFADPRNATALTQALGGDRSIAGFLRAHLGRIRSGDYFAILAYLARTGPYAEVLQAMRTAVRDRTRAATCLGFGPRFLHSTGQAYKGGPNTGVFLQITCDDAEDIPVPGRKYSFGIVKAAEARGDFAVLAERNRRALRVHMGRDVAAGLRALQTALAAALPSGRAR